ncbi:MAG: hypothetical protein UT13_C0001G0511 [Candidatus Pacebacteria bacterium GW2011_GWF2_38_9]|nr:MAG: hypothetical protein US20_C0008G0010 [Candidatus Pacebacteria bacterium GW2011_GWF1_36_5]KKQ88864.1 MAG: hypothetical protein UT13_C0001G0511 [Candidatus Pacebacteria bacterium GW2011_GWF2_38_9]
MIVKDLPNLVLSLQTLYHNLMFAIISKLRQSEGLKHSVLTIFSYGLASAFSALAVILISRLLGPTSFADFSVAFSLSLILNRLNDFGLSMVIQKIVGGEWRRPKINAYLSLILKYRLVISILLILLGLVFSGAISNYLQISNQVLIPLTFLFSLSVTYFESAQITLQSLGKFKIAAYNYLLPSFIKFSLALIIFLLKITDVQLILVIYLLSTLPSLLIAEFLKPKWIKYELGQKFKKEQGKVLQLLKHSAFAIIAAGIIENMDVLFAKHYLSSYEAGLLAGVNRIAMLLYVVAYALANVLNPRAATYKNRANFDSFLKKAWGITALAVFAFFLSLPFAPLLIHWTIGPAYAGGSEILVVLLAAGFISIALMPFIATFYAFKSNLYFSLSAILQLVIVLVGNFYFVPKLGLTASVYTRLIARIALLVFTWLMLWINYRREFKK